MRVSRSWATSRAPLAEGSPPDGDADDDSVGRQVRNLPEATPSPHEAGVVELRLPAGRQLLLLHLTGGTGTLYREISVP